MNCSNKYLLSCGPGELSGWYWTEKAGRFFKRIPSIVLSKSEMWVTSILLGIFSCGTQKPWFWLVISTTPFFKFFTGWLAPRWPWNIFVVLNPAAIESNWCPMQIPKIGILFSKIFLMTGAAYCEVANGSPGPFDKNTPSGLCFKISAKEDWAGSTVILKPWSTKQFKIFSFTP